MTSTAAPKAPKNKAVFSATTPDGQTATRSSGRNYTHALAVYVDAEPEYTYVKNGCLIEEKGGEAPEGAFNIKPTQHKLVRYDDGTPMMTYSINVTVPAKPAKGWSIYSFHGSEALALKSASQWGRPLYRVVPAEVVEDRRS